MIVVPSDGRLRLKQVAGDVERYSFDITSWLDGDTLQSSSIDFADAGIGVTLESPTVILASSPSAGVYDVKLSFTSASGRVRIVNIEFVVSP